MEILFQYTGKLIFLAGLVYVIFLIYLIRRYLSLSRLSNSKNENLKEEINTLNEQIKDQKNIHLSLKRRVVYYNNLRNITNQFQDLSLQQICRHLVDYAFYLPGKNKGCCLLYLAGQGRQELNLFLSKKENKNLVIKQKQGDIFDYWVVRHTGSLLVEDTRVDFRFDLEKTKYKPARRVLSLISAPLKVEQRLLGVLRLDDNAVNSYSQDDLRFLDVICNVGALGLENALLFQHTQELAIKDSLTSFYTKGYYLQRINQQVQRAMRRSNEQIALFMIDIDNFKDYNDRYGHVAGDMVLKGLSRLFREFFSVIPGAIICRFGGEEFSVFLPDITKAQAEKAAWSLQSRTQERRFVLRRQETRVTVSIGLSYLSPEARTAQDLILRADAALYRAKESGRNQVCVC